MQSVEFIIKEGDENLTSHSGLALIGALLNRTELGARVDSTILPGCKAPKIPHGDIVKSMVGLLCMGKPDYDAIEAFRDVPFFGHSLGIGQCPASPTLRQRLDVVNGAFDQIVKEESAKLIRNTAAGIGTVSTSKGELTPLDIDVSPFDNSKTKKEGVSRTYKGNDGFAPIFAYLGTEGYQVNVEFRLSQPRPHGTEITAVIQKGGVNLLRRFVDKPFIMQRIKNLLLFVRRQG